jgi:NodT family efflux transporter outer membrane factor (OMF) lipoprotein
MLRIRRIALCLGALALADLTAGCTAGPNFARPAAPQAPAGYAPVEQAPSAPVATLGEGPAGRWWQAFGSPELNALVDRAMANNPTLAASDATLRRAGQRIAEVGGRRLPQVDANARVEHEQMNLSTFGFPLPATFANPIFDLYSLGGGVSYDPDLWGKNRRALEQARAEGEAQLHQTEAAHLTIAGRVVTEYLMIAAIRDRIATQTALIDESSRNLSLTRARQTAGSGTMVEVLSAQAQLAADEGELPALRQNLAEARDMLAILLGVTPAELGASDYTLASLTLPTSVPVTLPSELVHKRPDILTAEARLHAAVAAIGVAKANLYPDIALGATWEQAANTTGSLLSSNFRGFDLFGGVSAPIFHGGSLRAAKRGAEDEAAAAAASYRETVLSAFGQVSDLLSALSNDANGLASARQSASVAEQSLVLSRKSFQVGNSGILQVLDASRTNQRAQIGLLEAETRQYVTIARLYVATAGGWTGTSL